VNRDEQGLGARQRKALDFIRTVHGWHSFAKDVAPAVRSLAERGLVVVSEPTKQFRAVVPVTCDQCEPARINGHFCHEQGCPNEKKTWVADRAEWVRFVKCFHCGCDVEAGECCGCCVETGAESEAF